MRRIFMGSSRDNLPAGVRQGLEFVAFQDVVKPHSRVVIKPNFTFPFFKPGVTTPPQGIEALVGVLREVTPNITIVESDGGARAWEAEEAFEGHDLPRICRQYDVKAVNLSRASQEEVNFKLRRRKVTIPMSSLLLHETDVLITMPVPKIHCMTVVSLALKNQWGCLPDGPSRFTYHPLFDELIVLINIMLKPQLVVADCSYMLTGNGPIFGDLLEKDLIVVSDDVGSFELAMLDVMGFSPSRIGHILEARRTGIVPESLSDVTFSTDPTPWKGDRFFLKRTIQNYLALAGFHSRLITWFGYESPVAGLLHRALYALIGGNPFTKAIQARENRIRE